MLHDTHAHLDLLLQRLGDLPSEQDLNLETGEIQHISEFTLGRSRVEEMLAKHDFIIQPSVSTENFNLAFDLFESFSKVYFLLGSHPEIVDKKFKLETYLEKQREVVIALEEDTSLSQRLIGIGEVGLDYHYSQDKLIHDKQASLFEEQIALAIKLKLPLVIHCREAFNDLFAILKEYPAIHGHFLVHCFTENIDTLRSILDYGGKIGIGGVVTFNSSKPLQEAVSYCPLESFVLETDLPFLAPMPHRGQICMPDMIDVIAEKVAELKSVSKKDIWHHSLKSSKQLFGDFL